MSPDRSYPAEPRIVKEGARRALFHLVRKPERATS